MRLHLFMGGPVSKPSPSVWLLAAFACVRLGLGPGSVGESRDTGREFRDPGAKKTLCLCACVLSGLCVFPTPKSSSQVVCLCSLPHAVWSKVCTGLNWGRPNLCIRAKTAKIDISKIYRKSTYMWRWRRVVGIRAHTHTHTRNIWSYRWREYVEKSMFVVLTRGRPRPHSGAWSPECCKPEIGCKSPYRPWT